MTSAANWSIAQRLGAGFALLMLILATLVAFITWQIGENDRASETLNGAVIANQRIDELERSVLLVAVSTRDVMLERSRAQLDAFDAAQRRLDAALLALRSDAGVSELVTLGSRYASAARRAVSQGDVELDDVVVLRQALQSGVRALVDQRDGVVESALQRMRSNRQQATEALILGAAATGLLFIGIAVLTTRSVSRPARDLVVVATALREGDWQPALRLVGHDAETPRHAANEIAQIGLALGAAAAALELREQRLAAHAAIAKASGNSLEQGRIAEAILRTALDQVQAEVGAVFIPGADAELLMPVAVRCVSGTLAPVRLGEGLVGQCARDRRTVVWRDIPPHSGFSVGLGYDQAPPRCVVATPLALDDKLLGVLVVASLRDVDDGAVAFLEAASAIVAVGLMNARAYEEVQLLLKKLQAQSERIQAQNEELQAQNEEIQSQNEELHAQTEELQAQGEQMQVQNEELQAQSAELQSQTMVLQEQAGALRQADAHKNEFLGLLAHELRNPLTPMSNCVELLSRRSNDPQVVSKVETILGRQVRHMKHLVEDLLDVARVTGGKVVLNREQLNLIELVQQCLDDHRIALDEAGVVLSVNLPEVPIFVDGDNTRICQVFSNLLGNAIKFCQPGSSVSVEVTLDAPDRRVAIHVSDTGIGIEPAMLSRIFEPFFQADSDLDRTKGGLGLGLALAKGLVELHGGRIKAHSDGKGHGAEFVVSLPLADRADVKGKSAEAEVTPLADHKALSARVLIIDDNTDAAGSLATLLELDGCVVRVAYSARSGVDAALDFGPEAVFCDIGLPGMDGYAFAREARQHPQLRDVLLIALTGHSTPADQQRAAEAGFDVHVTKPADYERIVDILRDTKAGRVHSPATLPGEVA